MPEEKIDAEAIVNAPNGEGNSSATPAETKEVIDPRIASIIGEEKIESAFGEQPKKEEKPAEEVKKDGIPPVKEEPKKEDQENAVEDKEVETPNIPSLESKPTRLDRRLASRYIRNLHLTGETKIPTEEEVIADLKKYSKEEKIEALHFHLQQEKKLRGEKLTGDDFDEDDKAAIQDANRESIRQEILQEEHEKQYKIGFVEFVDKHPELLPENKKVYDPVLAKAVETLFKGGMPINEAFETVVEQIKAVKDAQVIEEKRNKSAALSGVLSGTGQVPPQGKVLDWEDVERISKEDPAMYRRMVAEGKFKHLD